jgi:peptidoglycan/xylan/chitin deacetylase (PgdA/CDA1 family)
LEPGDTQTELQVIASTMRFIGSLRHFPEHLRRRFAPRALIVLYHRVVDLPSDPQLLGVTPRHFAEQLEAVRKYAHPLRLQDLASALRAGDVPRRAVVFTFDDGYADNLLSARPLLERYDIPATVFVASGHVGNPYEFWWDELDLLLLPGTVPEKLELNVNGSTYRWEAGEAAEYSEEDYERDRGWHIEQPEDPGPRQRLYRSLYQLLHNLPEAARQQLLKEVRGWSGAAPIGRPTHRTMSPEEVVRLAEGDLIEVGAHTVTHPVLALLPALAQRDEIRGSKAHLEVLLNRPVTSFAYPHGAYTDETLALVREAGFACACSSDTDAVWRGADCFRLPRVVVRDWNGEEFARWLKGWFGG